MQERVAAYVRDHSKWQGQLQQTNGDRIWLEPFS